MTTSGVTLLELLIVMILGVLVLMGASVPFMAERNFWGVGRRQAEVQRDAQVVMRSIARFARESETCNADGLQVTFTSPDNCTRRFQTAGAANNQLQLVPVNNCPGAQTVTLIDGNRSEVTQFTPTRSGNLLNIALQVAQENEENASLQTQIYLRNA